MLFRSTKLEREFRAHVSLFSFDRINLNTAPPQVLAAAGLDPAQTGALQDRRRSSAPRRAVYFRSLDEAGAVFGASVTAGKFGTEVKAMGITVTVRDGRAEYRLYAAVAPPGGAVLAMEPDRPAAGAGPAATETDEIIKKLDYPFKVLEIREDVEAPAPLPTSPID